MQNHHIQQLINKLNCIIESRYSLDLELLALSKDIQIAHNGTIKYCRNIKNHGSCKFGNDCWFRHTYKARCHFDMNILGCGIINCKYTHYNKRNFNNNNDINNNTHNDNGGLVFS